MSNTILAGVAAPVGLEMSEPVIVLVTNQGDDPMLEGSCAEFDVLMAGATPANTYQTGVARSVWNTVVSIAAGTGLLYVPVCLGAEGIVVGAEGRVIILGYNVTASIGTLATVGQGLAPEADAAVTGELTNATSRDRIVGHAIDSIATNSNGKVMFDGYNGWAGIDG